jgi:hypothetical protein
LLDIQGKYSYTPGIKKEFLLLEEIGVDNGIGDGQDNTAPIINLQ